MSMPELNIASPACPAASARGAHFAGAVHGTSRGPRGPHLAGHLSGAAHLAGGGTGKAPETPPRAPQKQRGRASGRHPSDWCMAPRLAAPRLAGRARPGCRRACRRCPRQCTALDDPPGARRRRPRTPTRPVTVSSVAPGSAPTKAFPTRPSGSQSGATSRRAILPSAFTSLRSPLVRATARR
jgi:hypothetical protein